MCSVLVSLPWRLNSVSTHSGVKSTDNKSNAVSYKILREVFNAEIHVEEEKNNRNGGSAWV